MLHNYKSIAACDVALSNLTFLVGPKGAGKSNFLDSLEFVADALRTSLDHALKARGGIQEVRLRLGGGGRPRHFGVRLDFGLPNGRWGHYAFRLGARPHGAYEVQQEECVVQDVFAPDEFFRVVRGEVSASVDVVPPASKDRLHLVIASGLPEFRPVYDALSQMGFHNLNPDRIRDLQSPDAGDLLARDGSNLGSVLGNLEKRDKAAKRRIEEYLSKVVPGVVGVELKTIGPKETLEFLQVVESSRPPCRFLAANMSDGTLRALAALVAVQQRGNGNQPSVPLVGIEEPEVALHPAAAGVLLDSLRENSEHVQIVVTSHSPDLLDDKAIGPDSILAVLSERGMTQIGSLDEVSRSALLDHLYTAGELLRLGRLAPHGDPIRQVTSTPSQLFDREAH